MLSRSETFYSALEAAIPATDKPIGGWVLAGILAVLFWGTLFLAMWLTKITDRRKAPMFSRTTAEETTRQVLRGSDDIASTDAETDSQPPTPPSQS